LSGLLCLMITLLTAALASCGRPQQVIASGAVGADGRSGDILLRGVRVAAPPDPQYPAGADADVWLTLINVGRRPDALVGVTSPVAGTVVIRSDDDCDGTAGTVARLTLPPASGNPGPAASDDPSTTGAFDSYSLRLIGLTREIPAGTSVPITFEFQHAPAVTLTVPVRPRQEQDNPGHVCVGTSPASTSPAARADGRDGLA
jgi:copper(I)-binding protein